MIWFVKINVERQTKKYIHFNFGYAKQLTEHDLKFKIADKYIKIMKKYILLNFSLLKVR